MTPKAAQGTYAAKQHLRAYRRLAEARRKARRDHIAAGCPLADGVLYKTYPDHNERWYSLTRAMNRTADTALSAWLRGGRRLVTYRRLLDSLDIHGSAID